MYIITVAVMELVQTIFNLKRANFPGLVRGSEDNNFFEKTKLSLSIFL